MKTKILLVSLAVTAISFTSCTKTPMIQSPVGNEPIQFSTYIPQTPDLKGLETTDSYITLDPNTGFGVNAIYTGASAFDPDAKDNTSNFMYNQHVAFVTGAWTYSPMKYWPKNPGEKISFFAWAPYGGEGISVLERTGLPNQINFSINDNPEKTVDFVAAAIIDQEKPAAAATAINFSLKHELTRLSLTASTNVDTKTSIIVTKVQLLDTPDDKIYKSGVYTFAKINEPVNPADPAPRGNWTVTDADLISEDYDLTKLVNMSEAIAIGSYAPAGGLGFEVNGSTPMAFFEANHHLYLIPVTPDGTTAKTDIAIKFTYDIVTRDGTDTVVVPDQESIVELPEGFLKQGKSYASNIEFKQDGINMTANVVTTWD